MIKTTSILIDELHRYSNPACKIGRMVKNGEIFPIVKGLYETDRPLRDIFLQAVYTDRHICLLNLHFHITALYLRLYMSLHLQHSKRKKVKAMTPCLGNSITEMFHPLYSRWK